MGNCGVVPSIVAGVLLGGCAQLVGITDPGGGGPAEPPRDGSIEFDGDKPPDGSFNNACATVPDFGNPTNFSAPSGLAITIGDLNQDGILDLVYADGTDVRISRGLGTGNFAASQVALAATPANGVLVADLDADGRQDLITWFGFDAPSGQMGTNTVRAHRQSATAGTFLAAQTFVVPGFPGNIVTNVFIAPKLNDDARPDLVITQMPNGTTAHFAVVASPGTFAAGTTIDAAQQALAVLDIDGDGFDDTAYPTNSGVKIIYNKTAAPGTFDTPQVVGSGSLMSAAVGQFSGNGPRKDLLLFGGGALFVQNSARTFTLLDSMAVEHLMGGGAEGGGLIVVDLNGDGKDDVVGRNTMAVQCTSSTFYPGGPEDTPLQIGEAVFGSHRTSFADLNADGKLDLVQLAGPDAASQFMKVYIQ